jgi:hypothetical protein
MAVSLFLAVIGRASSGNGTLPPGRRKAGGASISARPYRGVFPVVPTIFDESGALDLEGQRRCIDFMIDAGVRRPVHPGELLRAVRAVR